MKYSLMSYSFRRLFEAGEMDIFRYIAWCKEKGFSQLDPWNAHLAAGYEDDRFIARVKAAAQDAHLPFGCIAVDGAHIYEPTEAARAANREVAYRWIEISQALGANQIRIDTGGPEEMPDDVFHIIVEGYNDLVPRARAAGIEVVVENHWGPTKFAANVIRVLDAVDGLGLLFDTNNWAEGTQEEAWEACARYASISHVKTFEFDENGNDPTVNLAKAIRILLDSGYDGVWGIESTPTDGDEIRAAEQTLALLKRELGDA